MALAPVALIAQQRATSAEVRYLDKSNTTVDPERQEVLRSSANWAEVAQRHPKWTAEFDERTGFPRRMYGDPLMVRGDEPAAKALDFLGRELEAYALPISELEHKASIDGRSTHVHFVQRHAGLEVFGSRAMVKLDTGGRVIAANVDLVPTALFPALMPDGTSAPNAAFVGLGDVATWERSGACWVAVPLGDQLVVRQADRITVHTKEASAPGRFLCLLDATTGELLYRTDQVVFCAHDDAPLSSSLAITGQVYTGSPLVAPQELPLPQVRVGLGSTVQYTDANGVLNTGITGPVQATFELRSPWSNVSTLNVTPSFSTTLAEGMNAVAFNSASTIQQRSAFRYVHEMREHMVQVLPGFTGMDYELPVRVDLVSPNCNAFYDGSSINFYEAGNNCRSLATINDVVYHEYAHGINDTYYNTFGSTFTNGAMDEGYADVWALSLAEDLVFGEAVRMDFAGSAIRRYDGAPRVYPVDLLGDRHNDGRIIAGAWMDLYQLLGNDMELMLALFKEAYNGLQAATPNGNEGQAFRDVLLDVLQADDDDGDITNGTPNGEAILQAFAQHGITLISDIRIDHEELFSAAASEDIYVYAFVNATFPSTVYIDDVVLRYRINADEEWTEVPMVMGNASYAGTIPAQNAGTVLHYHLVVRDIHGGVGAVHPAGAHLADPRLPHSVLVGHLQRGTEDADGRSDFGTWTVGQPGDNALRGLWAEGTPIPSYSNPLDPATICQPGTQHTPGGTDCWFTANGSSTTAPVGEQDVDAGSTTLLSPIIDIAAVPDAAISYWRWYTNAPPTGTHPGQDLWQVFASGDGGSHWHVVEETRTSQRAWRRKVFRVQDVLGTVSTVRLKFIASDSVLTNTDQGGASLVEAAIDDLELWGRDISSGIPAEVVATRATIWPTIADEVLFLRSDERHGLVRYAFIDMTGRLVRTGTVVGTSVVTFPVADLPVGNYVLRAIAGEHIEQGRFSVLHR